LGTLPSGGNLALSHLTYGRSAAGPANRVARSARFRCQKVPKVDWKALWPGQLQCLVRWLVAWRALLRGLVCCISNLILNGGEIRERIRTVDYCGSSFVLISRLGDQFGAFSSIHRLSSSSVFWPPPIQRSNAAIASRVSALQTLGFDSDQPSSPRHFSCSGEPGLPRGSHARLSSPNPWGSPCA